MGKYNNYKSKENNFLSLRCPAKNTDCGIFSNIFDNYDNELKKSFLLNMKTEEKKEKRNIIEMDRLELRGGEL